LRDRIDDIRARGAELVIVGNGSPHFAATFRDDYSLDCPLLVDPDLRAYRVAGLRRGRVEILSPRLPGHAIRAFLGGARQGAVQGDPWQLGGTFVIRPGGEVTYRHVSSDAGDHAPIEAILAALAKTAPPLPEGPSTTAVQQWLGRALGLLVDPTVVLSFDRTGFSVHSHTFRPDDLDVDLAGKRVLITGANAGLGYEAALGLADLGGEVVLLCRSVARGEEAATRIREATGSRRVSVEELDVSRLASVRAAAARLASRPVDALIHNAGTLPERRSVTEDGLEITLATHVVGPFVLTRLLRGALAAAADARVIWVSSGGMYTQRLNLGDVNWTARRYDGVRAYAETKRAQVVLAELWAEELRGTSVVSNAMHPGWADTPGVRASIPNFWRLTRRILRTPAEGADTIVWLAACPRARQWTGRFFFDREPRRTHFLPFTHESPEDRRALWQLCERYAALEDETARRQAP
jgi:NAD(P)-dependent dehydrogenase (short-subunit alcohol dehydrogenase family)/peroxiredoxin